MSISVRWMVRWRQARRWRQGRHARPELVVRRRGRRLTLAAVALALAAAVVPVAVRAGTPGNDPANGQWVGGEVLAPGPEQLVLWKLPGSDAAVGTCIDALLNGPLHGPYARSQLIEDPVYGELNHLFAKASTSDVRLAELSALNSRQYDRVDRAVQWSYLVNKQGGLSVEDAAQMLDQATQLAGPYSVSIALPTGVRAGPTFTATVSVRSASKHPVPGSTVALTADNATLRARSVTTDASGQAKVAFTVPAGSSTKYALHASVQSWTQVAVYTAPGEQSMLSTAPPRTQSGSASAAIVRDREVALVKTAMDDPAHTPVAGYTFRIDDAAGNVVVPSVVSATTPVSLGRLTMGAKYVATELARPANATLYIPVRNTFEFTVPDGSTVWNLLAADPRTPTPSLATQVTNERVTLGQSLTDVVTVAGNDGEDGTIDAVLYGPVPVPRSGSCADVTLGQYQAAPATHVRTAFSAAMNKGNGQVTINGPAVTVAGCYGWAETLTLRPRARPRRRRRPPRTNPHSCQRRRARP